MINLEKNFINLENFVINWEDSGHSPNITSITHSGAERGISYGRHRAGAIYGGGETISQL